MSERKRFHPLAILIYWVQAVRGWLFLFFIFLINGGIATLFGAIVVGIVLVLLLFFALGKYFSRSYEVTPQKMVIYHGIIRKKETDIPYHRMQTIKQRQWFFFKPFHVTQLLIETAGGDETKAEASLPAVKEEVLRQIEAYRQGDQVEEETAETYDYQVTNGQIFLFGLTDLSILASLFAFLFLIDELIPEKWLEAATTTAESILRVGWMLTIAVSFLIILLVAGFSLLKNFIQYYNFRVSRYQQTLTIESGLFERKTQKIPLDKIQGIRIRQQLLRKLLGISTVELMLAGGQEVKGEGGITKLYLLPIVKQENLYQMLGALLPEWKMQEPDLQFVSRNSLWYFWRWNILWLPVLAGFFWFNRWAGISAVVLVLFLLLFSWFDYQYQGYAIQTKSRICIQTYELWTSVQTFVERPKVQAVTEQTTKWLYPKQIGHVKLFVKAGQGTETMQLRYIKKEAIQEIKAFYES